MRFRHASPECPPILELVLASDLRFAAAVTSAALVLITPLRQLL